MGREQLSTERRLRDTGSGRRHTFTATFVRYGSKSSWRGAEEPTVLLTNVALEGNIVSEHLCMTAGKQWDGQEWSEGNEV